MNLKYIFYVQKSTVLIPISIIKFFLTIKQFILRKNKIYVYFIKNQINYVTLKMVFIINIKKFQIFRLEFQ